MNDLSLGIFVYMVAAIYATYSFAVPVVKDGYLTSKERGHRTRARACLLLWYGAFLWSPLTPVILFLFAAIMVASSPFLLLRFYCREADLTKRAFVKRWREAGNGRVHSSGPV